MMDSPGQQSLGHSTIVVAISVAIALTAATTQKDFPQFQKIGGVIGTSVSAFFLLALAFINMVVLWDVFKTFQSVRQGGAYSEQILVVQKSIFARKKMTQHWKTQSAGPTWLVFAAKPKGGM